MPLLRPASYSGFDDFKENIDVSMITKLYQLRHACNVLTMRSVASQLGVSLERVKILYNSRIHGSRSLEPLFTCLDNEFEKLVEYYEHEEQDRHKRIVAVQEKNEHLIRQLQIHRRKFAGIGTNKAKRRLNKLVDTNVLARAVRLALEVEDKSISAKNSYGKYQQKIYKQKQQLIINLSSLFKEQDWKYGIQKSDIHFITHIIYFDIPTCEQISWHFSPEKESVFPPYEGSWDKKENSTLQKLEVIVTNLLNMAQ